MRFKILFPTGYQVNDSNNDNIDLNVVLENGEIYWGTLFTLDNIQMLLNKGTEVYFWATDMLIVKDLSKSTICYSVSQIIKEGLCAAVFSKIGFIGQEHFDHLPSFELLEDMVR